MINFKETDVWGFKHALRGMRNPLNSWGKADTEYKICCDCTNPDAIICEPCVINDGVIIGENDMNLAQRLIKAGTDHKKFVRQIMVSVDINAPMYWWKEYDTYKIATVANSTSTMHKIHSKPFEITDFSFDRMTEESVEEFKKFISYMESIRLKYIETKDKKYWYDLIQLLPSSYNQMRTCTLNYETLKNMYHSRKHHKLDEWHVFCDWIKTLPYAEELIIYKGE